MEHSIRRNKQEPDLILTIVYDDDSQDVCVIADDDTAIWTDYQQPKTTTRNIAIQQEAKDLKAFLLAIGAKNITLGPPVPPP